MNYDSPKVIDRVEPSYIEAPLLLPPQLGPPTQSGSRVFLKDPEKRQTYDMAINLFGFLPAGLAIAILLNRRMGNRFTLCLSAALLTRALSIAIELLQVHLPTRDPSYIDFAINSLAGTIAAICTAFNLQKNAREKLKSPIREFRF